MAGNNVGILYYFILYILGVGNFLLMQRYFLELVSKLFKIEKNYFLSSKGVS
jgi:hypothetical protein